MLHKFVFPNKGIHLVSQKVGEADFFLEKLKSTSCRAEEFNYLFSAFVSAVRSITFTLQYVMRSYPDFDNWYKDKQDRLRKSDLAKAFVEFRNQAQKTGIIPIIKKGSLFDGIFYEDTEFYVPTDSEIKEVPTGNVVQLSEKCLIEVLSVVGDCYKDFDVYIDPRILFSKRALGLLNWSIEDLEESLGFPKGYTDMDFEDENLDNFEIRLSLLKRYGGDETLQVYLDKYLENEK